LSFLPQDQELLEKMEKTNADELKRLDIGWWQPHLHVLHSVPRQCSWIHRGMIRSLKLRRSA
jgi:hypothetical protein